MLLSGMGGMGLPELAVMFALGAALPVYGISDALRQPDPSWASSGHSKSLWVSLMGAGVLLFFVFFPGAIITLVYLAGVRPSLRKHTQATGQ